VVFLDDPDGESAADRLRRLDALGRPLASDARVFTGSAPELADLVAQLGALGYAGVRLRPGVLTDDLPRIAGAFAAELRARGLFHDAYEAGTLRGLLGLPEHVPSRYAAV